MVSSVKVNVNTSHLIPVVIYCSSCNKELCSVVVVNPAEQTKWKVVAECCFCHDKSFEKTFDGKIAFASVQDVLATPRPLNLAEGTILVSTVPAKRS